MWMYRSSAESAKDDIHAQRMGLGCPIHAQRNEHIRMHQLRLSRSGIEHDERLDFELGNRRQAAWGVYKNIEDVVKKKRNTRLRAHLFNTTILPALTYASETWAFRKQEQNAVSVIERAIERAMLGVSRFTKVRDGIRSSLSRQRSKIRDAAEFAKKSKIRWVGHNHWSRTVNDWVPSDIKNTTARPRLDQ